jgi:uncharacterized membrane protein
MGAGMVLFAHSRRSLGWPKSWISRHLLFRGLILFLLQFFLENSAWLLGPVYAFRPPGTGETVMAHFGVLFALGETMIIGTLFLRSRPGIRFGLVVSILIGSPFLVPEAGQASRAYSPILRILFIPGRTGIIQVFYPVLPWLGIVLLRCLFGRWLLKGRAAALRSMFSAGGIFLGAFLLFRWAGGFRNIHPPEGSGLVSFLNVTKYPPSLTFSLLALGLRSVILGVLSRARSSLERRRNSLLGFGRSPRPVGDRGHAFRRIQDGPRALEVCLYLA